MTKRFETVVIGSTNHRVLKLLESCGRMTRSEIKDALGGSDKHERDKVCSAVTHLVKNKFLRPLSSSTRKSYECAIEDVDAISLTVGETQKRRYKSLLAATASADMNAYLCQHPVGAFKRDWMPTASWELEQYMPLHLYLPMVHPQARVVHRWGN